MASISGRLVSDSNLDKTEQDGVGGFDSGLSGQIVRLLDSGGAVIATTTTDATGNYSFTGLAAGDYRISFPVAVDGSGLAQPNVGDSTVNSDADPNTGLSPLLTLAAAQDALDIDAIYGAYVVDGTPGDDTIGAGYSDAQGDQIDGTDGDNDVILAGAGNDSVLGGSGNDVLNGGAGDDTLDGGLGADQLSGGLGNDTLLGGDANDTLTGGSGSDFLSGGDGNDILVGGGGNATIGGPEILRWNELPDPSGDGTPIDTGDDLSNRTLTQTVGDTTVTITTPGSLQTEFSTEDIATDGLDPSVNDFSSLRSVATNAQAGTYTLGFSQPVTDVAFALTELGAGLDYVEIMAFGPDGTRIPLIIDAGADLQVTQSSGIDMRISEAVQQFDGPNDPTAAATITIPGPVSTITISHVAVANELSWAYLSDVSFVPTVPAPDPNDGNDTLSGGAGNDELYGGTENDLLFGGTGNDTLSGGDGVDTLLGNDGDDQLFGGAGNDWLEGDGEPPVSDRVFTYTNNFDGADPLQGGTQSLFGGAPGVTNVFGTPEDDTDNEFVFVQDGFQNQGGVFAVDPGLTGTERVETLTFSAVVDMGSDNVDGLSINFGDLSTLPVNQEYENGVAEGLAIRLDAFSDVTEIRWNNAVIASGPTSNLGTRPEGEMVVEVDSTGLVQVTYAGDTSPYLTATIPAGEWSSVDQSGWQYAIAARTGASFGFIYADDISIQANITGDTDTTPTSGNDGLDGGDGDDTLIGGAGADTLTGGLGNDLFLLDNPLTTNDSPTTDGAGDQVFGGTDGALDTDVLDLRGAGPVTITQEIDPNDAGATRGIVTFQNGSTLSFEGIETILTDNVDGSAAGESMPVGYADADGDAITEGADTIFGNGGNDIIQAAGGDDVVYGGEGADIIDAGLGNDTVFGNEGDDIVLGNEGNDNLLGGEGNDNLLGGEGNDTLEGGEGNDTLDGGAGTDTLSGDAGNDTLVLSANDSGTGGDGDDLFTVDPTINDGPGTITIIGGEGAETTGDTLDLRGLTITDYSPAGSDPAAETGTITYLDTSGNQVTVAYSQIETVLTDADGIVDGLETGETMFAGYTDTQGDFIADGAESIRGNGGDDWIRAGGGNDTVDGGTGNDTIDGLAGADSLIGGEGNDELFGGNDNDVLDGGVGNDYLAGDDGNDTLTGGAGSDQIYTGTGNDTAYGGDGDDFIYVTDAGQVFGDAGDDWFSVELSSPTIDANITITGGETGEDFTDPTNGGAGDILDLSLTAENLTVTFGPTGEDGVIDGLDTISGDTDIVFSEIEQIGTGLGADTVDGSAATGPMYVDSGAGDDSLLGGSGNDTLAGGEGNDQLSGGAGNDSLFGDAGNDTLAGGSGADALSGGAGNDSLILSSGDTATGDDGDDTFTLDPSVTDGPGTITITGGEGLETAGDTLILTGLGPVDVTYTGGDPASESGSATYFDANGDLITVNFSEIENLVVCFTRGSMIATDRGEVPVEQLTLSDRVITMDDGYQPVRWVGSRKLTAAELALNPKLRPIRIRAGALGQNLPIRDLVVSPQHRILVRSKVTRRMFNTDEVLVPAKALLALHGVEIDDAPDGVEYWHILFDRHQVIFAEGAPTESLFTGPEALKAVSPEAREEILTIFPELADPLTYAPPLPARPLITVRRGAKMAERLSMNHKTPLENRA